MKKASGAMASRHTPSKCMAESVGLVPEGTCENVYDVLNAYNARAKLVEKVLTDGNPVLKAVVTVKNRVADATGKVASNIGHGIVDPIFGEGATLGSAVKQVVSIARDPVGKLGEATVCGAGEEVLKAFEVDPSTVGAARKQCDKAFDGAEALRNGGIYLDPSAFPASDLERDLRMRLDLGEAVEPVLGPGDYDVLTSDVLA